MPRAAVVAGYLDGSAEREEDWVRSGEATPGEPTGEARVYAAEVAPGWRPGPGCALFSLDVAWRLDPGWQNVVSAEGVWGPRVIVLQGSRGQVVALAGPLALLAAGEGAAGSGRSGAAAVLVLLTGGADLDARDLGDLYGVLVADDGSIRLDGTALHGAVFAGRTVDLGCSGQVAFSRAALRWATDRSLVRARLVRGTRTEGTE